jgi:H+/Cl- antiporter ClcA
LGYDIWFFFLGLFSSFFGQTLLNRLIKKYQMKSLIILCIVVLITIATVLLLITGTMNVVESIRDGDVGFHPACKASE